MLIELNYAFITYTLVVK